MRTQTVCIAIPFFFTSCSQILPGFFQAVDEEIEKDAVTISINKSALQYETDVKATLEMTAKVKP